MAYDAENSSAECEFEIIVKRKSHNFTKNCRILKNSFLKNVSYSLGKEFYIYFVSLLFSF